jgi:hypothetical protein
MIYLVGGAPRVGKSILGQQVSANLQIGWVSTDVLAGLLRVKDDGVKAEWNADPDAIAATAEWFFPYLERFVWGVSSLAENYLIEGVAFLPAQVAQLAANYPIRSVFLGCSGMTPERFDQFPGRSPGYGFLPDEVRHQFAQDVPRWSEYIRQEAQRFGYPYIDMDGDFPSRLSEASAVLTAGAIAE